MPHPDGRLTDAELDSLRATLSEDPKPLTFTLSITLGNDAMQTPAEIADRLSHVAMVLTSREVAGYPFSAAVVSDGTFRDTNGNTVGEWRVQ